MTHTRHSAASQVFRRRNIKEYKGRPSSKRSLLACYCEEEEEEEEMMMVMGK